ncbi:MAG: RAMP superfamily CRISPR-associated protein [Candidatus Cloacimonadales bacterium]|jgi:CRISPR/Cas system CSM-associated protein Csm3 (group 7 of RAMP superfamily)|nr:RAMP superfamily CRISPR-associated protein [Candidatus Cloacimonadota bacterium]MDX9978145.1 RAMP superfamily CRISPR-associated protein [Candidatus Cloacimonadales bacterium]
MTNYRYLANFIVEADTPLKVGSGDSSLLTDALIMTDCYGLPMILGTSLTGVLRHSLSHTIPNEDINDIFGYQQKKKNDGAGSRLIVSNAYFVIDGNKAIEGITEIDWDNPIIKRIKDLPLRQHAKISHLGTADKINHGKYDEQVVYKGTRFCFEIELIGSENDKENWGKIIDQISQENFRIGGGTRKGFGKLKVIELRTKVFNLKNDINSYLSKTASVNDLAIYDEPKNEIVPKHTGWTKYSLTLEPENTWLFGSGFGDDDVDMTPVYEDIISWDSNHKPSIVKKQILIPATSIKGAVSHRVAYHYNKLNNIFADDENISVNDHVGENNEAVNTLFGSAKNTKKGISGSRGIVILSDLFVSNENSEKIFNHVAIDRFTGGALDSALYDEKVITQKNEIKLEIFVEACNLNETIKEAFKNTLSDICSGNLPLGGGTMRGHGCFTGKMEVING